MLSSNIQKKISMTSDLSKLCYFEVEFQDKPTTALIHSTARFLLIKKGCGKFLINGVEYPVKPNTMIVILPWDITTITQVDEDFEFYKIVYNFSIINDSFRNICNISHKQINSIDNLYKHPIKLLDEKTYLNMEKSFIEIKDEVGNHSYQEEIAPKEFSDVFIISQLLIILIKFLRYEYIYSKEEHNLVNGQNDANQILKYMYSHLAEKLTLEKLATTFFTSKSSLSKYIEENVGFTFSELLSEMRFSKAIDLLMYSELSYNEIAKSVGYTDSSHFTKVFQASEGMTPGEFRSFYDVKKSDLKSSNIDLLDKVIKYQRDHFQDEDLTVGKIAKEFGLSTSDVNKLIYFQFEKSFYEYLDVLRVSKACELLKKTDLKIIDIGLKVGYNSTRTFQRAFNRITGVSPSKFRSTIKYQDSDGNLI
ncbi:MAG: AraC family transcriptional regulator [Peptoniphilaceae bacterium]|nr:AraC family transcriptional regulator [Peptoniphilaceae bacterium]MDY6019477.1 AraC family transcriptional regulator [Anaerococcus sp.]